MQVAGLGVRDVLGVVREARETAGSTAQLVVTGILSGELARALRTGATEGNGARVGDDPIGAAALIVVLGGDPTTGNERAMRTAVRASVPVIAVQTDPKAARVPLAYVPASAVVVCPAGQGFPFDEIARALEGQLGHDAAPLAARVPVLRDTIVKELVHRAALRAAMIGGLPWRKGADLPALALIQARLVLDLATAYGRPVDQERGPDLAAVVGTSLGVRALVRRLPRRLPLIGGVTGYLTTRALGEAAIQRFTAGD